MFYFSYQLNTQRWFYEYKIVEFFRWSLKGQIFWFFFFFSPICLNMITLWWPAAWITCHNWHREMPHYFLDAIGNNHIFPQTLYTVGVTLDWNRRLTVVYIFPYKLKSTVVVFQWKCISTEVCRDTWLKHFLIDLIFKTTDRNVPLKFWDFETLWK